MKKLIAIAVVFALAVGTAFAVESRYEDPAVRGRIQTSPVLVTYYTRAQAESLVALFSQEYLQGLGRPSGGTGGPGETKPDAYNEY